jgi:hypothetical protein
MMKDKTKKEYLKKHKKMSHSKLTQLIGNQEYKIWITS